MRCKACLKPETAAVGMRINASKTKVMSTLIPGEQRQAVLLDSEPLEDVDKFKHLGSIFVATRRYDAGLTLVVPHSLACYSVFGGGRKYRYVQRAGSTRQ